MKMTFLVKTMDCAACAAKVERAISKLEGVKSVSMSFLTQKLNIEVEDEAAYNIEALAGKIVSKIERGVKIVRV